LIYCGDKYGHCPFSRRQAPDEGLPVVVVDEEIYRNLPALLIATVDKFAQMPWNGAVQMLFGQVNGRCTRHGFRSPEIEDKDSQLVTDNWVTLEKATSLEILQAFRQIGQLKELAEYTDAQVWEAIQKKRAGGPQPSDEPSSLKRPEWEIFSQPSPAYNSRDFRLKVVPRPEGYSGFFEKIVLGEKLREVRALIGFTRLESAYDFDTPTELPAELRAPLSRQMPTWVPASEIRGEGIFFQFSEKALQGWEKKNHAYDEEFFKAHRRWRESRGIPHPDAGYPGIRFVLLHTFALRSSASFPSSAATPRRRSGNAYTASARPMESQWRAS